MVPDAHVKGAHVGTEKEQLAALLTEMLSDLRMTGAQIAEKLGVDRSTISRWASGARQPNAAFVRQLDSALEEYLNELIDKFAGWQGRLGDIHIELLEEEWPEDTPFNKEALISHIEERDKGLETEKKKHRSRAKKK